MKNYAELDVSVKETAICIVDENGRIRHEAKVVSHPEDLSSALMETGLCFERIGLEAGPLSQWLFEGMARQTSLARGGNRVFVVDRPTRDNDKGQKTAKRCVGSFF